MRAKAWEKVFAAGARGPKPPPRPPGRPLHPHLFVRVRACRTRSKSSLYLEIEVKVFLRQTVLTNF